MTQLDWIMILIVFNNLVTIINLVVLSLKSKPELDYRVLSEYSGSQYDIERLKEQYGIDQLTRKPFESGDMKTKDIVGNWVDAFPQNENDVYWDGCTYKKSDKLDPNIVD